MDMITLAMAKAYTDSQRLGYADTQTEWLLPETTKHDRTSTGTKCEGGPLSLDVAYELDKSYTVIFNGKEYVCTAQKAYSYPMTKRIGLGNLYLESSSSSDTGEPFVIYCKEGTKECVFLWLRSEGETVTVAIKRDSETIHTIDPKYLPKQESGGLPFIELTTVAENKTCRLSEEENSLLDAVNLLKTPLAVRLPITWEHSTSPWVEPISIVLPRIGTNGDDSLGTYYFKQHVLSGWIVTLEVNKSPFGDGWFMQGSATYVN